MRKIIILAIIVFNVILITTSVQSGLAKGNIALRFQEKETVTFFSAALLLLTSFSSFLTAHILTLAGRVKKYANFWFLSGFGFFYLAMDEYFMAHEGIDKAVAKIFVPNIERLEVDGVTIGVFGLIALCVCFKFRQQIMEQKEILRFFFYASIGFIWHIVFDLLYTRDAFILIVLEESSKIIAVSLFFGGFLTVLLTNIKRYFANPSNN